MEFVGRPGYYCPFPNYRIALPQLPLDTRYRTPLVSYPARCTCECYCDQSYGSRYGETNRRQDLRGFPQHTAKELNDVFSSAKPGRRNRTTYKRWQIDELEQAFLVNPYPTSVFKKTLAVRLGLRDSRVQVWFQNRRAKSKRDRQSSSSPIYTTDHNTLDYESTVDSISTCAEDIEELIDGTEAQVDPTKRDS